MRPLVPLLVSLACGGSGSNGGSGTGDGDSSGSTSASGSESDATGDETEGTDPGHWETLASLPGPRQETGVAAIGGKIYVVGGFVSGTPPEIVDTVEAYDPPADSWSSAPSVPQVMHHANTAGLGDTLIVTGFLTGLDFAAQGDVYAWTLGDDGWQSRTPMPAGSERGGSGVAVEAGQIYVFGGLRDGKAVDDASTYVVQDNSWQALPPMPAPRDHLVAGAIEGKLYVVAGREGGIEGHSDILWIFDPKSEEWSTAAAAPTSRGGVAGAVHEDLFYVFGGEGNPDDPDGVFGQAEFYDPLSDTWQSLPDMPTPRHGTGAAAVGNRIHVPGGADIEAFAPVATHEAWVVGG